MSNLPPPTSGGAPYQPEQPTVAFNPLPPIETAPQPKKSSTGRLIAIIGAAVVVVAALAVGAFLVFGGDDDAGTVDAAKASGAVEDTTVAAGMQRTDHLAALKECPFGGIDDLADDAPEGFDAATAAKGDDRAILNQTEQRDDPLLLQCASGNEDGTLLYGVAAAALPPTELKDYISRTLTDATADFETTSSFRGGTLLPFCTKPNEGADVLAICATAWYDKQLMAAIFTTGKGSSTDVTTAWIKEDLDDVVEDLEGADPDKVEVTATQGFTIDSGPARANLDQLIDAAQIADPGAQADQTECLVADFAGLLAAAPTGLDQSTLTSDPFFSILRPSEDGDPPFALCVSASEDNVNQYGVLVGQEPPDDFEAYVKRSAQTEAVNFDDPVDLRGGVLHGYCGTSDGGNPFCETDWVSGDLQVGIFAAFDGVTSADTNAALTAAIDEILAVTTGADASKVTPAS